MTDSNNLETSRRRRTGSKAPLAVSRNHGAGIALALGGGFSRGFAHLGVLDVIEQEQIPISAIVGTSIGGLLGAAYADGISVEELCELGRQVRVRDFLRFQTPSDDILKTDRIGRFVREWFQASRLEELSIPTVIVTTDLNTCAPYVFSRGSIEVAIRATCAFPGLFKPVEHEGRLLADGCIVSPVPTEVAARMDTLGVLGVVVSSKNSALAREVSKVFHPSTGPSSSLFEPSWTRHADVLLQPEIQNLDWDDFSRVDEAREAGAQAMRRAVPQVRKLLDRRSQMESGPEDSLRREGRLFCESS